MNLSELAVAYSPSSPILEDVVRNAISKLFAANNALLKKGMSNQINLPNLNIINNTVTLPSNVSGINLKWNITLPDKIKLPVNMSIHDLLSTMIKNEMLKNLLDIHAYNKSHDLKSVYSSEKAIRSVICAIEFDDSLIG